MALRSGTCDPDRLEQLLRDRLPEEARRQVEAHLFLCPACRGRLDDLAGGPRWWGEVRRFLGGDGAAEQPLPTMEHSGPRRWPDLDLSFLEPSADPGSLGRLGGYEVLEVLGRGGWGVVLKAFDRALHRPVAIKVLAEGPAANATARKRFAREARAAAAVVHDHVVPVYAVDADATPPYLVMAFIPGQSLQQRIDLSGPLELKEVLRIATQTAAGLAAAHAQGLVHRDIKPANIMLENGIERVRITDFGLARAVDDASVTHTGSVAGTPQYMAPEQARGEAVDQRADLFALGSTLYAMCTGRAPFRGESGMAVIRQVCDVEPRPIRAIDPEVPAWLEGIVRKLHAKQPAERFQSAAEVSDLLEHCLAHVQHPDRHPLPALAAELGKSAPDPLPRQRIRRRPPSTAAVLGLVLLTGAALFFLQRHWPRRPAVPVGHEASLEFTSPDLAPAALALTGPGEDVVSSDELRQLRSQVEELRRSLTDASQDEDGMAAPAFAEAARRAGWLEQGLTSDSEPESDPVASQIEGIRRRLDVIRQQLGVRPP
jgi:eukaryotic-like serine/threonine-protein kinase